MRLIDADVLRSYWLKNGRNEYNTNTVLDSIDRAPTVDAEPVQHGHWFMTEYEYFTCSECGQSYYNECENTREAEFMLRKGIFYAYCPHCGAKMNLE